MISFFKFSLLAFVIGAGAEIVPGRWTDICAISDEFANSPCCVPNTEGSLYGYEFEWLDLELSWKNAQDECRDEDDTSDSTLVIFESATKKNCIMEWLSADSVLQTRYHDFAIGLHMSGSSGNQYEWDTTDNTETFPTWTFPWASGYPENLGCVYTDIGYDAPEPGFFKDTDCYDGQKVFPICQRTKVACHGVHDEVGETCEMANDCCHHLSPCQNNVNNSPTCGGCVPSGERPSSFQASDCCSGVITGEAICG